MNANELALTKRSAAFGEIIPAGISRFSVLGLALSMSRSKYRLNAIAAERAKIIHKITKKNKRQEMLCCGNCVAKKNPKIAKGSAKMV